MRARALVTLAAFVACTSRPATLPGARFANAPPVEVVDDRRDVATPPAKHDPVRTLYFLDATFHRPVARALALPRAQRALGVNALDEVPDSSWFTNRIGQRALTTDELIVGPTQVGSPEPHKPWTIHSRKDEGEAVGFNITDARGERFLLKFDRRGYPQVETTAHVIVNRLLWASGYHVPEDFIVYLRPEELRLAADASRRGPGGDPAPLTRAEVAELLATLEVEPGGRLRGMASRILDGKPLGGTPDVGVRRDDPNDRIPHERRRDRRGALPIFAWLDHVDVKETNSLDMWIEDPADPRRHHVRHYLLDFGKSLGAQAAIEIEPRSGHEYRIDLARMANAFLRLGFASRPWSGRQAPRVPGVGLYDARTYDPGSWRPYTPASLALLEADRFDVFWGAKILIRFTPTQLRALVESMRLSDPRAVDYLTATLVARQRATARHAFTRVNPLDRFELVTTPRGPALCFDDLVRTYQLATETTPTRYATTSFDRLGRRIGDPGRIVAAPANGRACTAPLELAADGDGYTIVRVTTHRPGFARSTLVHLARAPGASAPRVIGIWRE